jgi:hypothetical protein
MRLTGYSGLRQLPPAGDAARWKYHSKLNSQESCVFDSEDHHIRFLKT